MHGESGGNNEQWSSFLKLPFSCSVLHQKWFFSSFSSSSMAENTSWRLFFFSFFFSFSIKVLFDWKSANFLADNWVVSRFNRLGLQLQKKPCNLIYPQIIRIRQNEWTSKNTDDDHQRHWLFLIKKYKFQVFHRSR